MSISDILTRQVIGGLGTIDLSDWKTHTRLKHCTAESSQVIWFWRIVGRYDEEMRARLLQFVTGSSRVPLQGFKALQGSTGAAGPRLFTLHLVDVDVKNLPKAHTCFNRFGSLNLNTNNLNISKIKAFSTTLRGHSDSDDPFIIVEMLI